MMLTQALDNKTKLPMAGRMAMFKQLLLPVDLTDKHSRVVQTAAEMVKQRGGSITLFHVVELIPGLSREEDHSFYDRLERDAQRHLDKIGQSMDAHQVRWQTVIQFGNRVQETLRFAEENHVDLILLTAPTFDAAHPGVGWGSLSFKISMLSPIRVLLVKP
jgi:nucleotide-binding universal stress UspA family protein